MQHGIGHENGHGDGNDRAFLISRGLTGVYFSTLQIEATCLDESGAEAIHCQLNKQGDE